MEFSVEDEDTRSTHEPRACGTCGEFGSDGVHYTGEQWTSTKRTSNGTKITCRSTPTKKSCRWSKVRLRSCLLHRRRTGRWPKHDRQSKIERQDDPLPKISTAASVRESVVPTWPVTVGTNRTGTVRRDRNTTRKVRRALAVGDHGHGSLCLPILKSISYAMLQGGVPSTIRFMCNHRAVVSRKNIFVSLEPVALSSD